MIDPIVDRHRGRVETLRMPFLFIKGQALAAPNAEKNVLRHYLRTRHPIKVTFGA